MYRPSLRAARVLVLGLWLGAASTVWAQSASLRVSDAWVRSTPPGVTMSAAYLTIHNDAAAAATLVRVEAAAATTVELHRTTMEQGMMRMGPVRDVPVPARGTAVLKPGGYHVMLIGLRRPLAAGQRVALVLHFADGTTLHVEAEVRPAAGGGMSGMHEGQSGKP